MTDERPTTNRRTVLRSTGTLLAGTALATAPAAAQLQPSDCADVVTQTTAYESACPATDPAVDLQPGEHVQVLDSCTDWGGNRWVQVATYRKYIGVWVDESDLTPVPCR